MPFFARVPGSSTGACRRRAPAPFGSCRPLPRGVGRSEATTPHGAEWVFERRCRLPEKLDLVISEDAVARRFRCRRPDAGAGRGLDHVALREPPKETAQGGEDAIRHDRRASVHDAVEQVEHVALADLLRSPVAPLRIDLNLEVTLDLGPGAISWLAVSVDEGCAESVLIESRSGLAFSAAGQPYGRSQGPCLPPMPAMQPLPLYAPL